MLDLIWYIVGMYALVTALVIMARISWYDPYLCTLGPEFYTNCGNPTYWWRMSGGLYDARDHYWRALACPVEFELGSRFIIEGTRWGLADGTYVCLDRGGAIVIEDGIVWLDLLTDRPIWGDVLPVRVITPQELKSLDHCGTVERSGKECR